MPASPFLSHLMSLMLVHTATVQSQAGVDAAAEPVMGGSHVTPCLTAGSHRRIMLPTGEEQRADYEIVFGPGSVVATGDILTDVRDQFGNLIAARLLLINTEIVRHHRSGPVQVVAYAKSGT